jgi:hypothetical protein
MDTSPEYILMCDKAEEIQQIKRQKSYPSNLISQFWQTLEPRIIDIAGDVLTKILDTTNFQGYHYIWLPRQDQLQEMIGDIPYYQKLRLIYESFLNGIAFEKNFTSMEQLWLAFVMKEKFNKTWDGTEWVKDAR